MNFCGYERSDLVNGEGVRCSLWVSGCSHGCRGCFNQKAWSYSYGQEFSEEHLERILADLSRPFVKGLSVLGGEPLDPENIDKVCFVLQAVRNRFGNNKDIMVWTGYLFEEIPDKVKELADKIMDGKFEVDNPTTKRFRGSDNQRLWCKTQGVWGEEL